MVGLRSARRPFSEFLHRSPHRLDYAARQLFLPNPDRRLADSKCNDQH
jgi:hypothetical protein